MIALNETLIADPHLTGPGSLLDAHRSSSAPANRSRARHPLNHESTGDSSGGSMFAFL